MKITVIGCGYVGLVTAACFAELGNEVMCVEKDPAKRKGLSKGRLPVYEPGVPELFGRHLKKGRIRVAGDIPSGVAFSDVIFLCVGTPEGESGEADLSQLEEASRHIARAMNGYKLIIEKSTVPVNTHRWVKKTIERYVESPSAEFDVASNPEFLKEGTALADFMNPDRIVVGVESDRARNIFEKLYEPFTAKGYSLIITTPATAELIKHASNSFLAMKISFINMIADLCEKVGADVSVVADGVGADKRIGRAFLNAGIGWGGSCFGKDLKAFVRIAEENGVDFGLLKEADKINAGRRKKFVDKTEGVLWINRQKNIAVWGLAFKPETDDVRDAPSLDILRDLHRTGANLRLYDPEASKNFAQAFGGKGNVEYVKDKYSALKGADALIILTEWDEFRKADMNKVKKLMRLPIIIDGRNIFEPSSMKKAGFEYYSVGRSRFDVRDVWK